MYRALSRLSKGLALLAEITEGEARAHSLGLREIAERALNGEQN